MDPAGLPGPAGDCITGSMEMSITPEQIAHVLELIENRPKGKIRFTEKNIWESENADAMCDYLVAVLKEAPLMAQIIRHQQEQLRVAREALEKSQSLLAWFRTAPNFPGWKHPSQADQYDEVMQALSLIDNFNQPKE